MGQACGLGRGDGQSGRWRGLRLLAGFTAPSAGSRSVSASAASGDAARPLRSAVFAGRFGRGGVGGPVGVGVRRGRSVGGGRCDASALGWRSASSLLVAASAEGLRAVRRFGEAARCSRVALAARGFGGRSGAASVVHRDVRRGAACRRPRAARRDRLRHVLDGSSAAGRRCDGLGGVGIVRIALGERLEQQDRPRHRGVERPDAPASGSA